MTQLPHFRGENDTCIQCCHISILKWLLGCLDSQVKLLKQEVHTVFSVLWRS